MSPASAQRGRCPSLSPPGLAVAADAARGWPPGFKQAPQDCELRHSTFDFQDPESQRDDSVTPSSPNSIQEMEQRRNVFFNEPVINWPQSEEQLC